MTWPVVQIEEVMSGFFDGPHATPAPCDEGPVFLGIKNLTDDGHLDLSDIRHISEAEFPRWTKRVTPAAGDIVFTYEATLNRYAIVPPGFRGCLGRRMALIRPNSDRVDTRFLHYSFFSPEWRETIAKHTVTGSTVDRIPLTRFPTFPLRLPPLPTQRRIAGILSAYDDLIENNTKRIKILEEMARALYREWFVHFRFPGHEKVKLVDSPLGEIPEGWDVSPLVDLQADIPNAINGGPFGSKLGRKDYVDEGVPVIRGANLTTTGRFKDFGYVYVSPDKAETLRSNFARPGDIVVTQRGTLGQVARIPANTDFSEFVISQSQMKVTFDRIKIDNDYGFYCLKSTEAVERLKNLASSSGVPHINLSTLREFQVRVPPFELQCNFGTVVSEHEALIENLNRQNSVLADSRDLLLPRLMSGEIDVDNLDLPEAAQ